MSDRPVGAVRRMLPFYLGGFLGPFGTLVIIPMLPELRAEFGVDSSAISWAFSAYLFPMAALLLVSGTIGERFGKRRVLQVSLVIYTVASALAALAPNLGIFLALRALQGAGNAFITPLLIAALADITPDEQLGRRVGVYTSFQAAGGGLAPFAGGLAAEIDWRLAFWATAAATILVLAFVPEGDRRAVDDRPDFRSLINPRLIIIGMGVFAAAAGPIGAGILVGFKSRDVLNMEPTTAGLLLAGGNLGSVLLAPRFGLLLDRYGSRVCGVWSSVVVSLLVSAIAFTETVATTALVYAAAGAMFGFVIIVFQKIGASMMPDNRGGALSALMSFRFVGHAVGPLMWVPVFGRSVAAAFIGSGLLGLVTIGAVLAAVPRESDRPSDVPLPGPAPSS